MRSPSRRSLPACCFVGPHVELVMKAAGIPKNASGIGGFINGAHALITPALVMVAAVAPLALIAGGVILLFGGRRGMQIVGTALGVLLLLGSVTADRLSAAGVVRRQAAKLGSGRALRFRALAHHRRIALVGGAVLLATLLFAAAAPRPRRRGSWGCRALVR